MRSRLTSSPRDTTGRSDVVSSTSMSPSPGDATCQTSNAGSFAVEGIRPHERSPAMLKNSPAWNRQRMHEPTGNREACWRESHMQIPSAFRPALFALAAAAGLLRAQAPTAKADLVLVNARVYTVDDSRPNASAFAVRNGRIVFVGSDREARFL